MTPRPLSLWIIITSSDEFFFFVHFFQYMTCLRQWLLILKISKAFFQFWCSPALLHEPSSPHFWRLGMCLSWSLWRETILCFTGKTALCLWKIVSQKILPKYFRLENPGIWYTREAHQAKAGSRMSSPKRRIETDVSWKSIYWARETEEYKKCWWVWPFGLGHEVSWSINSKVSESRYWRVLECTAPTSLTGIALSMLNQSKNMVADVCCLGWWAIMR